MTHRDESMARLVVALAASVSLLTGCRVEANVDAARAQIDRGRQLYEQRCAVCHQPGGIGTELTGRLLASRGTALRLFDDIRATMPYDDPGSLAEGEYWDVTAFLVADRRLVETEVVLSRENAREVRLGAR